MTKLNSHIFIQSNNCTVQIKRDNNTKVNFKLKQ